MRYLMLKYRWFAIYNFVVWIIHLKGSLSHPNVNEFHLLSCLTCPTPTNTLEASLEQRFLEDNDYNLFCVTENFVIIIFNGIKYCT